MASTVVATRVEPEGIRFLEELPGAFLTPDALSPRTPELADARVLCVQVQDRVTRAILEAAPNLELVVTRSTGIDNVDVEACDERGIRALHLPAYATESVAEIVEATIVLLLRRGLEGHARARAGRWDRSGLVGRRPRDVTVGVVGVGRIGKAVTHRMLRHGARVVGHDILDMPGFHPEGFAWMPSLAELLPFSDVLTLHVPLTPDTRHLVGADELARLPEGALLVNASRGPVVDSGAVLDALDAGILAGAAFDVLAGEPAPPHLARLAEHPNVLVTPHLAAYDVGTAERRYAFAARLIRGFLATPPSGGSTS